ncbi:uncharacterized protein LOC125556221 isoform X4 [Triticum urartu]|uniref:uncharacterized protein LOC125556221 isoform X4 n=1 Tax=Triticum urartu TaxID=4572 RepID=UPI00204366A1|nr:uncharacterized protein LOC125556221 isoform X4 [Triticum urartu]
MDEKSWKRCPAELQPDPVELRERHDFWRHCRPSLFSSEFVFAGTDLFFCWKLFFCRTTDASRRAGGNDVDQGDAATMANRELELTGGGD